MPIRILAPEVVARIAAGEVVERPASVVKELVENSLDAGASQISVETAGGGVGLIRVTDNGSGIPPSELAIAFERHATSKVGNLGDLDSISSLGFRGEALPSIAAVAQIDIGTCTEGDTGSYISLQDGKIANQGSQAHSRGTTVTVRNLFRSVPARLKFLKSPSTENSHIASVVSQYALAFPEVKFILSLDNKTVLRTPGSGRLIDAAIEVYGIELAQSLLEVGRTEGEWNSGSVSSIEVTGMVGSPSVSRSGRDYLSFFVNRRWINSRTLSVAVEEAYHGLLMQGRHPVAIINISISPAEIDINIHPAKTEIKFRDERLAFSAVQKAVRKALIDLAPVPAIEDVAVAYGAPPALKQTFFSPPVTGHSPGQPVVPRQTPAFSLPALRLLGQIAGSYIIAEGPDGLYIIDQHAAHERILFEKVRQQHTERGIEVQGLLEPATLDVDPRHDAVMKTRLESLADFGFTIEAFGERTYLVRTVPALLHEKDWRAALRELLESPSGSNWTEKVFESIACHSAVRAGQVLSDNEMRELIRQLEQVALPNTCPHGRPTMIRLPTAQMEKDFGRA